MLLATTYVYALTIAFTAFIAGLGFGLGVAVASRLLTVLTEHKVTYDNLDKRNA